MDQVVYGVILGSLLDRISPLLQAKRDLWLAKWSKWKRRNDPVDPACAICGWTHTQEDWVCVQDIYLAPTIGTGPWISSD